MNKSVIFLSFFAAVGLATLVYSGNSLFTSKNRNYNDVISFNHKPTAISPSMTSDHKIQVALLLDTSNSMDGLIDQAKSRLWNIVNTLSTLKFEGKDPKIEIALYEYGNDRLSARNNFIRQITPFTSDLDLISQNLFNLTTNGGEEYCGAVLSHAKNELRWNDGSKDIKLIYIAGNESFNQGPVNYNEVIKNALDKSIFVNTILCGNRPDEERSTWRQAAIIGQGKFVMINSDEKVIYINTPYDDKINELNLRLNDTYIGYGQLGREKKQNQSLQDSNASSKGSANLAERAVSKSSKVYENDSWDILDKYKTDSESIEKMEKEELPDEWKDKSKSEIKILIEIKLKEREAIQKEIGMLSIKRQKYIEQESAKDKKTEDLGEVINQGIYEKAKALGYSIQNN